MSPWLGSGPWSSFACGPHGLAQASCQLLLVAPWLGPGLVSSVACGSLALPRPLVIFCLWPPGLGQGGSDKAHDAMPGPCFLSSFACGPWAPVPLHHEPYFGHGPVPVIFCLWPCFGPGPCVVTVQACTVDWSWSSPLSPGFVVAIVAFSLLWAKLSLHIVCSLVIFCLWALALPRPLVIFCLWAPGLAQASCHLLLVAAWPGPGPLLSCACEPLAWPRPLVIFCPFFVASLMRTV